MCAAQLRSLQWQTLPVTPVQWVYQLLHALDSFEDVVLDKSIRITVAQAGMYPLLCFSSSVLAVVRRRPLGTAQRLIGVYGGAGGGQAAITIAMARTNGGGGGGVMHGQRLPQLRTRLARAARVDTTGVQECQRITERGLEQSLRIGEPSAKKRRRVAGAEILFPIP